MEAFFAGLGLLAAVYFVGNFLVGAFQSYRDFCREVDREKRLSRQLDAIAERERLAKQQAGN